jgi:3-oxoacid CoA-transferase subunit A
VRVIDGHEYVLESPLKADFAIVRAWKADTWGNLVFRKTARNFSPLMCMAAKVTIVEAEHIVPVGELEPDQIHVPSVYVKRAGAQRRRASTSGSSGAPFVPVPA